MNKIFTASLAICWVGCRKCIVVTKPGQKSAGGRNFSEATLESSLGHVLHEFLFLQSVFSGFSSNYGSSFNDICCRLRTVVSLLFACSSFCIEGRSLEIYLQNCINLCNLFIAAEMQDLFFLKRCLKNSEKHSKIFLGIDS